MDPSDRRNSKLILLIAAALWAMAYLWSISILVWTDPTGDSFTRGLNRIAGFVGWQLAAGLVAMFVFAMGRRLPKGALRWLTRIPILLAVLLFLGVVALLLYSWITQLLNPPVYYEPPTTSGAATQVPQPTQ